MDESFIQDEESTTSRAYPPGLALCCGSGLPQGPFGEQLISTKNGFKMGFVKSLKLV